MTSPLNQKISTEQQLVENKSCSKNCCDEDDCCNQCALGQVWHYVKVQEDKRALHERQSSLTEEA